MKCCDNQDVIMIGSLEQYSNGDYVEKSFCNNCETEFLDVWEHASKTIIKYGDGTTLSDDFDFLFDIKTYGELRDKVSTTRTELKLLMETIEQHNIKL